MKSFGGRAIVIAAVFLGITVFFVPIFVKNLPSWWKNVLPSEGLRLGLDLQGGVHLVLEVDVQKAVEIQRDRAIENIKEKFQAEKVEMISIHLIDEKSFGIQLAQEDQTAQVEEIIQKEFPNLTLPITDSIDIDTVIVSFNEPYVTLVKDSAIHQAIDTIRNRIDQFGVAEPIVQRQGTDQIVIQLPGMKDPRRAIELVGRTAQLEFKIVDTSPFKSASQMYSELDQWIEEAGLTSLSSPEEISSALQGKIPEGSEILFSSEVDPRTQRRSVSKPYLVKAIPALTGDLIEDAAVRIGGQYNTPYVSIDFSKEGATIFEKVTGENVEKQMAIVLDGTVYSAPVIREKIGGGKAVIEGRFTTDEARDLAIVLRSGALPAPVTILERRTVGPSLGQDSIQQGVRATLIGAASVVLFMGIYYQVCGLIADAALLLNLFLILGLLSAFGATLTLPGIAGIALTLGMAVDANVLINERIREELRLGKTPRAAIDAGYDRVFWTIMDSNLTTLLAGVILFQFGTGPIKGFAVTLSIGIVTTLFTSLFVTRLIFDGLSQKWSTVRI
ncbi:MAG: protein translocase subunit SecD [Deltaproteobacteria bacterium]|nr:protein translocase subunit SecD [Deltaproteobacteria bacterium]